MSFYHLSESPGGETRVDRQALEVRRQVRVWLTDLYRICEQEQPEQWMLRVYRHLTAALPVEGSSGPHAEADLEATRYIRGYADFLRELLSERYQEARSESASTSLEARVLRISDVLVHEVAEKLALPEPLEIREDEKPLFMGWN